MSGEGESGSGSGSDKTLPAGTQMLPISECEDLLRTGGVGLLALAGTSAPIQRPVNYSMQDGGVLIRTGEGQILEAAQMSEPASFAIAEIDRFEHTGWSVVVTGVLSERSRVEDVAAGGPRPWARDAKHHFVGLSIEKISGRRIVEGAIGAEVQGI
jgi:nitroimidazol reductase NimA-like FMN-containing flavoprotein (pyridoxamine 5'-phosphate oxidase superfamily)